MKRKFSLFLFILLIVDCCWLGFLHFLRQFILLVGLVQKFLTFAINFRLQFLLHLKTLFLRFFLESVHVFWIPPTCAHESKEDMKH